MSAKTNVVGHVDGLSPSPSQSGEMTAVVVLGMHRSGTSALAGVTGLLGATPPKSLLPANEYNARGYWESVAICQLNDEILKSGGSSWNDWRKFNDDWYKSTQAVEFGAKAIQVLREEYGDSRLFVFKDPRICRLTDFWFKALREFGATPKVVLPVRSPIEVAYSLRRVHRIPLSVGILYWLRHVLEAEKATRGMSRAIVDWNDFMKDWRLEMHRISAKIDIAWPRFSDTTAAEVDQFVGYDLQNFTSAASNLNEHPDIHEWVIEVYDALKALAREQDVHFAEACLDDIGAKFGNASAVFGRSFVELEKYTYDDRRLRDDLLARDGRIGEIEPALAATQAEAARLLNEVAVRDGHIGEIEPALAATQAAAARLINEVAARDGRIGEIEPALAATQAEVGRLQTDLTRQEGRNAELRTLNAHLLKCSSAYLNEIQSHQKSWPNRLKRIFNRHSSGSDQKTDDLLPRLLSPPEDK